GAILISENRVAQIGTWNELKSSSDTVIDLGESILLPGLVNAHCHLDYTEMAGMISAPKSFSDWIKGILALKAAWSYSEYAQSWLVGAKMLPASGTTSVVDIESVPELLPDVWSATPLRVTSLLELTNVKSRLSAARIVHEATQKINSLNDDRCRAGLSPHALYSTSPELLQRSAEIAREKNWLVSTHVSESREEFEMFEENRGALFDWLKNQREMSDTRISPVQQLHRQKILGKNFLAVHANYISESDIALLAKKRASVIHCPRSHHYFAHQKFPFKLLQEAGVNVCLGTDSLASVKTKPGERTELNMFSEMQSFATANPDVPPEKILQMATLNGARALGMQKQIGELAPNSLADLIAVPFAGKFSGAHEAVLHHQGNVSASMIDGNWVEL
ncbi:MAG: amidohydrolase family protein, partial [Verrucomicrobiota bacterium]